MSLPSKASSRLNKMSFQRILVALLVFWVIWRDAVVFLRSLLIYRPTTGKELFLGDKTYTTAPLKYRYDTNITKIADSINTLQIWLMLKSWGPAFNSDYWQTQGQTMWPMEPSGTVKSRLYVRVVGRVVRNERHVRGAGLKLGWKMTRDQRRLGWDSFAGHNEVQKRRPVAVQPLASGQHGTWGISASIWSQNCPNDSLCKYYSRVAPFLSDIWYLQWEDLVGGRMKPS